MDKFKCNITSLSKDFTTGQAVVTLTADASILPQLEELSNIDLSCTLKKHQGSRRSLNANSYMWVLLTKLQDELQKNDPHITKDALYMQYIKSYGTSVEYQFPDNAVKAMTAVWSAYGLGWFADRIDEGDAPGTSIIRFYYGSSSYGKKRMARLIDAVVIDCKAMGIQTMTPDELAELKARWGEK